MSDMSRMTIGFYLILVASGILLAIRSPMIGKYADPAALGLFAGIVTMAGLDLLLGTFARRRSGGYPPR